MLGSLGPCNLAEFPQRNFLSGNLTPLCITLYLTGYELCKVRSSDGGITNPTVKLRNSKYSPLFFSLLAKKICTVCAYSSE